ncbi:MAG: RpiB/LacA/LacB family sugar-phosphate isomerase [Bacilli bacterium]
MLKIAVGSDHGGLDYKNEIAKYLKSKGYEVFDVGTNSHDSCNYPVFGFAAANLVALGQCDYGVIVCTSGEGISIAANKVKGIRCGIGYNDDVTKLMRQHNDCNMIAFGQKFMDLSDVLRRIDIFLSTPFEGGRHAIRVDMIKNFEE